MARERPKSRTVLHRVRASFPVMRLHGVRFYVYLDAQRFIPRRSMCASLVFMLLYSPSQLNRTGNDFKRCGVVCVIDHLAARIPRG